MLQIHAKWGIKMCTFVYARYVRRRNTYVERTLGSSLNFLERMETDEHELPQEMRKKKKKRRRGKKHEKNESFNVFIDSVFGIR